MWLNHTIFIIVSTGETIFYSFRTSYCRQAMVGYKSRIGNSIQPIIIVTIFYRLKFGGICKYLLVSFINIIGSPATSCFSGKLYIFISGHHIRQVSIRSKPHIAIIRNLGFTGLASLSCNNDNSIGTTGSINSCCRRIFQHIYLFNIIRIHKVQISTRHSVNDNQRRGRSCYRINTTDFDVIPSTRFVIGAYDRHSGKFTLQSTGRVCIASPYQICIGHGSYRTCQIRFLHSSISHNHHFTQGFCILPQHNIQ